MNSIKLSVVIVNYNVRYFLEQCLQSVYRAGKGIDMEIFVVDNNSADGSCSMVRNSFPHVQLLSNHENVGFARANNQAIRASRGELILILNPDTIVDEFTFRKCIDFIDEHPDCGALGVKMIDGKGHFLPESKRALPTPWVSFYKVFGLASLFPKSRKFGKYHLGYLDKDLTYSVDVLPGAFMMIKKRVLDEVGLLDEDYFMYGEDIDLSYRMIKAGYKNYYFPETTIIHYKGESTKKGSINYVLVFYQAMIIFATKHFSVKNARWYTLFIKLAIYFRASLSIINRFFINAFLPILDAIILFLGYWLINPWWERMKFPEGGEHPPEFLRIFVPAYILIWILSVFFSGGYDRPLSLKKYARGMVAGTAIILVIYSLLPEAYRFSRALILIGFAWGTLLPVLSRILLHLLKFPSIRLETRQKKRLLIIGSKDEEIRVTHLLNQTGQPVLMVGRVNPSEGSADEGNIIGNIEQMNDIVRVNRIDEIIFCSKDLSSGEIIRHMLAWSAMQVNFKIAPDEGEAIIGSNSANAPGDLYRIPVNSVGEPHNKRLKRLFDAFTSLVLIILSPGLIWIMLPHAGRFFSNCLAVMIGLKSWVSFAERGKIPGYDLPKLKKGILTPLGHDDEAIMPEQWLRINLDYAKDYTVGKDLKLLLKNFRLLGNG